MRRVAGNIISCEPLNVATFSWTFCWTFIKFRAVIRGINHYDEAMFWDIGQSFAFKTIRKSLMIHGIMIVALITVLRFKLMQASRNKYLFTSSVHNDETRAIASV